MSEEPEPEYDEDYLHKKFFKIHKSCIPRKLKKPLYSLLKEELA